MFEMNEIWETSDKGQENDNLWYMYISMYSLIYNIYQFLFIDFNSFWVIHHLSAFLYKCIRTQSWPLHEKVYSQPWVIISTKLVVRKCTMLYTKFQWHRPISSKEDLKDFTIYGHGGHLGHVTRFIWTHFRSPIQRKTYVKFDWLAQWCLRRRLPIIKLTNEPSLRWLHNIKTY